MNLKTFTSESVITGKSFNCSKLTVLIVWVKPDLNFWSTAYKYL